tara:strand:+ start:69023 stop:69535 length:513 start_codon:yes stop_codon:yes gene_type:complete
MKDLNLDPEDNGPNQTISEKLCDGKILIGYGKKGHGMHGKHADLDEHGQLELNELITEDPIGGDSMRVRLHIKQYAAISRPEDESFNETVMAWKSVGNLEADEDTLYLNREIEKTIALSVDEYEEIEDGDKNALEIIAKRINEIIYKDEDILEFGNEVKELYGIIKTLQP